MSNNTIFISYASEDQRVAEALRVLIEAAFKDWRPFCASADIDGGDQWLETLKEKLSASSIVIVICTPASIRKAWVIFEAGAAWIRKDARLYPIVLSKHTDKSLPPPLAHLQFRELVDAVTTNDLFAEISEAQQISFKPGANLRALCEQFVVDVQNARRVQNDIDLFLSVPLKAWSEQWRLENLGKSEAERKASIARALQPLLEALDHTPGLQNYYFAGTKAVDDEGAGVARTGGFSADDASARENFDALARASRFLMILPAEKWTGSLFEAGFAFAKGTPSVYFVRKGMRLPFMVEGARGPTVDINRYDDFSEIADLIVEKGTALFPRQAI